MCSKTVCSPNQIYMKNKYFFFQQKPEKFYCTVTKTLEIIIVYLVSKRERERVFFVYQ